MLYRITLGITAMFAGISTFAQDNTEAVSGTAVNLVAAGENLTTNTGTVPMDQILTLTFLIPVAGLLALLATPAVFYV